MKTKFILVILSSFLFTFCSKDKDMEPQSQTEQISKIETSYKDGDVKIETVYQEGCNKIETTLSPELLAEYIANNEASISKQTSHLKSGTNLFGVFNYSYACGTYPTLIIKMDSEDNNCSTSISGDCGFSRISNNTAKDVYLQFCVVSGDYLFNNKQDSYSVLSLGSSTPTNGFYRLLDNEDGSNNNITTLNGSAISSYGLCTFGVNTGLYFYSYMASSTATTWDWPVIPNLQEYGVLGTNSRTSYKGWIYSDDEDNNNANRYISYGNFNSAGMIEGGANTKFYISSIILR